VAAADGEALGRSRGGLSITIHLAVDGRGRPLSVLLTPGQAGDNPQLFNVLDAIAVHQGGPGRPRKRPDMLIADKGYAHDPTRRALRRRGIRHTIPERAAADGHRPLTPRRIGSATSWNAASTGSNNGGTWPPATPNAPPSTAAPAAHISRHLVFDDRQDVP
jgi:transposase